MTDQTPNPMPGINLDALMDMTHQDLVAAKERLTAQHQQHIAEAKLLAEKLTGAPPAGPEVTLSYGIDGQYAPCGRCGEELFFSSSFGITHNGSRVCEPCCEKHEPAGAWALTQGLERIDTALFDAKPEDRPLLIQLAAEALVWLAEEWLTERPDDPDAEGGPASPTT